MDVVVTDLAAVTSSRDVVTYANGDKTMYMGPSLHLQAWPSGNADPFVGDEESLALGWFSPDRLPSQLAQSTIERLARVRSNQERLRSGDADALFVFSSQEKPSYKRSLRDNPRPLRDFSGANQGVHRYHPIRLHACMEA